MKNFAKFFGIIVFMTVIGFSATVCDNGTTTKDNSSAPAFLGDKLELSGQVYLENWNETNTSVSLSYQKYNGNLTVYDYYGGNGEIKNGNLSYSIETPVGEIEIIDLERVFGEGYDNFKSSTTHVVGAYKYTNSLRAENTNDGYFLQKRNTTHSGSPTSYSGVNEWVNYVYVEEDVTVSGKGKTETRTGSWYTGNSDDGIIVIDYTDINTTKNFNFTLRAGWNAIYHKVQYTEKIGASTSTGTYIETVSLSNPALKWVLEENYCYSSSISRSMPEVPEVANSGFKTLRHMKRD